MKRIIIFAIITCIFIGLSVGVKADAVPFEEWVAPEHVAIEGGIRTEYQDKLHETADFLRSLGYDDSSEVIKRLQKEWWAEQESLDILARTIQGETGGFCPWNHTLVVGAVVRNRVKSDKFPDTVKDVVAQPGQYTTRYLSGFDTTSKFCYEAAKVVLDGKDGVPEEVIWQANFPQGKKVWWTSYINTGYFRSTTYFCTGVYGE